MVLVLLDWSCTEIGSWKRLTGREIDDDVRAERRKVGGIGGGGFMDLCCRILVHQDIVLGSLNKRMA